MTMSAPPPARPAPLSAPTQRHAGRRALAADFDSFYQANYAGTVAVAFGLTGDRGEAQDLAQEAYCRAWQRWEQLSGYDNPAAWVYRVTVNLARSRWRYLRVAAAHLVRQRPADAPPADPEHVALVAALRALPMDQRQAIVLHHLVDLPVSEVAQEMGVPVGTVKSWLHRGRAELAVLLSEQSRGDGEPTRPQDVRLRGDRRRTRRRGALAAATAAACALLAVFAAQAVRLDRTPPPPLNTPSPSVPALPTAPPPSPAPVSTVSADDPMRSVDWRRAVVSVPAAPGCPAGRLTFRPVTRSGWGEVVTTGGTGSQIYLDRSRVAYGDLTGDGRAEAVLHASCMTSDEDSGDGKSHLLVVTRQDGGALRALGWAGERGASYASWWVGGQVVYAEMHPRLGGPQDYRTGMAYGYRWDGRAIVAVDVSAAYPPVAPTVEGRRLDLTPIADQLACTGLPAPAGPVRPVFDEGGIADAGDREWSLVPGAPSNGPHLVRLDPARRPYLLLLVACAVDDTPNASADVQPSHNLVVFDLAPDGWFAVARVPTPADRTVGYWHTTPGGLTVAVYPPGGGEGSDVTYRWTGTAFTG